MCTEMPNPAGLWSARERRCSLQQLLLWWSDLGYSETMRAATWLGLLALALSGLAPARAWPTMWGAGMGRWGSGPGGRGGMMGGCQVRCRCDIARRGGPAHACRRCAHVALRPPRLLAIACLSVVIHVSESCCLEAVCCTRLAAPPPFRLPDRRTACAAPAAPAAPLPSTPPLCLLPLQAMREGNSVVLKGLKFSGGELSAAQLPRHPETWQEMQVGAQLGAACACAD